MKRMYFSDRHVEERVMTVRDAKCFPSGASFSLLSRKKGTL